MRFEACAVYILANLNRSVLYVGVTSDLLKRIPEHRERLNPQGFTSRYRALYLEKFRKAVMMTAFVKSMKKAPTIGTTR